MLFILLGFAPGCSNTQPAGTAEQRDLGRVVLQRGLEFRLSPGTISDDTETSVEARASAPLPDFSLSTGPDGAEQVDVTLLNIHRDAEVRLQRITPLSSQSMLGCPDTPDGDSVDCTEQTTDPRCASPTATRPDGRKTELTLQLSQQGCLQTSYAVALPDAAAAEPLEFAVLGRTADLDQLDAALAAAAEHDPDFVVLLGDDAENASLVGLRELAFALQRADVASVVLPGEGEIVEGSRTQFLQTFGPFDFRWDIKDAHMVAFYSADAELGEDGVLRLDNRLSRLGPGGPRLLFTHTPPLDPLGPRDEGFESELEAARLLSVLTAHDTDALFVGHINDSAVEEIDGLTMHLTSVERANEYVWVRVEGGEVRVEHRGL